VLNNQQLYLVNHFALVARRYGVKLPDLKELMRDEARLRQCIESSLADQAHPAVAEVAAKLAAAMPWPGKTGLADLAPALPSPPARASAPSISPGSAAPAAHTRPGLSPQERALALAALQDAAGPIAEFIAEQVDALGPMGLGSYLDQAAALAQLTETRRRTLRAACGLAPF